MSEEGRANGENASMCGVADVRCVIVKSVLNYQYFFEYRNNIIVKLKLLRCVFFYFTLICVRKISVYNTKCVLHKLAIIFKFYVT